MKASRGRKSPYRASAKLMLNQAPQGSFQDSFSIKLGSFKGAQLTPAQLFMGFIGDDGASTQ